MRMYNNEPPSKFAAIAIWVIGPKLTNWVRCVFWLEQEIFLVLSLQAKASQSEMISSSEDTWQYLDKLLIVISGEVRFTDSGFRPGIQFNSLQSKNCHCPRELSSIMSTVVKFRNTILSKHFFQHRCEHESLAYLV